MIEAYEIGIRLALDDGVSAGVEAIRRELTDLDRVIDASAARLAILRAAADAAVSPAVPEPAAVKPPATQEEARTPDAPASGAGAGPDPGAVSAGPVPAMFAAPPPPPAIEPQAPTQLPEQAREVGSPSPSASAPPPMRLASSAGDARDHAPHADPAETQAGTRDRPREVEARSEPPTVPQRPAAAAPPAAPAVETSVAPLAGAGVREASRPETATPADAAMRRPRRPLDLDPAPQGAPAASRPRGPGPGALPPTAAPRLQAVVAEPAASPPPRPGRETVLSFFSAAPAPPAAPNAAGRPVAEAQPEREQTPMDVHVYLDGAALGRWMTDHLDRAASRPQASSTAFDPRVGPAWPGAPIG